MNEVGWEQGFERGENAVHILGPGGVVARTAAGSKREVAAAVWDEVARER